MTDYEERRHPINALCPKCLSRTPMRENQLEVQHNGGDDWRVTCADYSVCNYSEMVKGSMKNGVFVSRGVVGLDGWGDQ